MIDRLRGWLRRLDAEPDGGADNPESDLPLAACALLVETAAMDGEFDAGERATVERLIAARFSLTAGESAALVAEAERAVGESPQIFRFTNAVKARFDAGERVALLEMLWEVAYADGAVHAFEENLLRRVAGLLYVSDRDRGLTRRRVRERMGENARCGEPAQGEKNR